MGFVSGKYRSRDQLAPGDVHRDTPSVTTSPRSAWWRQRLTEVREELCTDGRTLVQGALAYVWARSHRRSRSAASGHPNRPANRQAHSPTARCIGADRPNRRLVTAA
jgi:hypothetical protein